MLDPAKSMSPPKKSGSRKRNYRNSTEDGSSACGIRTAELPSSPDDDQPGSSTSSGSTTSKEAPVLLPMSRRGGGSSGGEITIPGGASAQVISTRPVVH